MDLFEKSVDIGVGYTKVEIGSTSSPPSELLNTDIVNELRLCTPSSLILSSNNSLPKRSETKLGASYIRGDNDTPIQLSPSRGGGPNGGKQISRNETPSQKSTPRQNVNDSQIIHTDSIQLIKVAPKLSFESISRVNIYSEDDVTALSYSSTDVVLVDAVVHDVDARVESPVVDIGDDIYEAHVVLGDSEQGGVLNEDSIVVVAALIDSTTITPVGEVADETPTEEKSPRSPMSAFATFTVITALVRMQKRIKNRYQRQREDLINELGL